jgi:cytochrome P450
MRDPSTVVRTSLPPGPKLPPLAQTLWYVARPVEFFDYVGQKYGDTVTIRTVAFGTEILFSRPEAIKEVFTGDAEILRAGEANAALGPFLGSNSVLLLDGAAHMRQRRLMLPPFHGERMSAYTTIMVEATERALASWPRGETRVLRPIAQRITLDIIVRAVFGAGSESGQAADLGDAMRALLDRTAAPLASLVNLIPALQKNLGPLTPWAAFERARDAVDEKVYALIAHRRKSARGADILSLLLDAKDEDGKPMTDRELRDELMTLLAAGHETTATTLCWLMEELLARPEVMRAIDAELADVVGNGALEPSHVPRLRVLDSAIKEAMRMHPVIPAVGRKLKAPTTIAGWDLPAGVSVVPAIQLTHRLPDIYPDPNTFKIDRFLDKKVDPYAWLPFGGGVRRCIGMAFALHELKVVTATMLARRKLRLKKNGVARAVLAGITHAPAGGTAIVS